MQKIISFEKKYTVVHMFFILILNVIYSLFFQSLTNFDDMLFIAIIGSWIVLLLKTLILENEKLIKIIIEKKLYNLLKLIELVMVALLIVGARQFDFELSIIYLVIIIEAYIANEELEESIYKLFYILPFIVINIIYEGNNLLETGKMLYFVFYIMLFLAVQKILELNIKEIKQKFYENKLLIKEKNDKNVELMKTQESLQELNEKLKEQKLELEKATERFRSKAAEFYVLKEIGAFLESSLEIENLLELVIDVLSGVMGVDMCCTVLYPQGEEDKKDISFHIKTVYDKKTTNQIRQKIESGVLGFLMNNRDIYLDNEVTQNKNLFFENREVGSFAAVPLYKGDIIYGLVILEQRYKNYFHKSIVELLKSVATQIVLAIENARLYESVEELAIKDPLTKVFNRVYMQKVFFQMIEDADKTNKPMSVSMFDIDHFKHVNDTYGHLFGDKVLKMVAKMAQAHVTKYNGVVIRYGGEEFLVLMPNKNSEQVYAILESLRKEIESTEVAEGVVKTHITVSFGVTTYPELVTDKDRVIRSADNAVYVAKESGRNKVVVANSEA
ncbi:MAG: hypothetical protein A2Y24_05250 [Clostridiales bacterium GWE2_32_10]|nr:MAG: hypothetical protein A2Y24_05250 [Clostridiales bacterium GWE2_32_10]HBY21034.1 hypothetical protein [Clostridiales bacterium]